MLEYEEELITEAKKITVDTFSHASSSQRENSDAIFTSQKLEQQDELVKAINNLKINDSGYQSNKATAIDAQGDLMSDPYTFTATIN